MLCVELYEKTSVAFATEVILLFIFLWLFHACPKADYYLTGNADEEYEPDIEAEERKIHGCKAGPHKNGDIDIILPSFAPY